MRGIGRIAGVGLVLLAACSGGGGGSAASTTSSSATTSTTLATTTTTSPEEAVKAAWDGYWKMIDRLIAAPDPGDPELAVRAVDPVLSVVRDDMTTRRAEGRTTRPPTNSKYAHHIQHVDVSTSTAQVDDCFVDDRVQFAADGSVLNDHISTVRSSGTVVLRQGEWIVSDVHNEKIADGDAGCAS